MTTNEDVHRAIRKLEERAKQIKNKHGNHHPILLSIQNLIGNNIANWLEFEMDGSTDDDYNEKTMNSILDMLNYIKHY